MSSRTSSALAPVAAVAVSISGRKPSLQGPVRSQRLTCGKNMERLTWNKSTEDEKKYQGHHEFNGLDLSQF